MVLDVRDTVMILYVICQLVCVTDPWAHMSLLHSILSLKSDKGPFSLQDFKYKPTVPGFFQKSPCLSSK